MQLGSAEAGRVAALEALAHLAVSHPLVVVTAGVVHDGAPPETHRIVVRTRFDDLPAAREAAEDEARGNAADPAPPEGAANEELRHAVFGGFRSRGSGERASNERKARPATGIEYQQRMRAIVTEPAGEQFLVA